MFIITEGSKIADSPMYQRLTPSSGPHYTLFMPEKNVATWFFESGMAEKTLIEWVIDNFVKEDKIMIDIGAHLGTYSWTCAKKAQHVFSFECSPKTFCYLAANIALHSLEYKITPLPYALGDKDGNIEYYERSIDGGGNGVKKIYEEDNHVQKVTVPMKTLDSFGFKDVGFIKLDVEGFEKEVLMGAVNTLRENNYPPILFESWGSWKKDVSHLREELFSFLTNDLTYTITPIRGYFDMFLATKNM
jgi:FkbM family methyltransferase